MVTLFYIKKEEDSLYFRYFIKIVDSDMCIIGLLWIELRKLKVFKQLKKIKKTIIIESSTQGRRSQGSPSL